MLTRRIMFSPAASAGMAQTTSDSGNSTSTIAEGPQVLELADFLQLIPALRGDAAEVTLQAGEFNTEPTAGQVYTGITENGGVILSNRKFENIQGGRGVNFERIFVGSNYKRLINLIPAGPQAGRIVKSSKVLLDPTGRKYVDSKYIFSADDELTTNTDKFQALIDEGLSEVAVLQNGDLSFGITKYFYINEKEHPVIVLDNNMAVEAKKQVRDPAKDSNSFLVIPLNDFDDRSVETINIYSGHLDEQFRALMPLSKGNDTHTFRQGNRVLLRGVGFIGSRRTPSFLDTKPIAHNPGLFGMGPKNEEWTLFDAAGNIEISPVTQITSPVQPAQPTAPARVQVPAVSSEPAVRNVRDELQLAAANAEIESTPAASAPPKRKDPFAELECVKTKDVKGKPPLLDATNAELTIASEMFDQGKNDLTLTTLGHIIGQRCDVMFGNTPVETVLKGIDFDERKLHLRIEGKTRENNLKQPVTFKPGSGMDIAEGRIVHLKKGNLKAIAERMAWSVNRPRRFNIDINHQRLDSAYYLGATVEEPDSNGTLIFQKDNTVYTITVDTDSAIEIERSAY